MFGIPVVKRPYDDPGKVSPAVKAILEVIRPGDIINTEAQLESWWDIETSFGWRGIWFDQKYVFGEDGRWKDEHSTVYLGRDLICSVQRPAAKFIHLRDCCLDKLSLYRYTKADFSEDDAAFMREAYSPLWGTKYDYGQLLDIFINTVMGYDDYMKYNLFDFGKARKVCSVGARILYEKWIKHKNKTLPPGKQLKPLFRELNPDKAALGHVRERFFSDAPRPGEKSHGKRQGVDVEMTTPAHFANTDFFDNEFKLVAQFEMGVLRTA